MNRGIEVRRLDDEDAMLVRRRGMDEDELRFEVILTVSSKTTQVMHLTEDEARSLYYDLYSLIGVRACT